MSQTTPRWSVGEFEPVAPGCYRAQCEPASVNVGLIVGSTGYVLIDTGCCRAQGRALRAGAEELIAREHGGVPLAAVILTHDHWDHAYGLGAFDGIRSIAHETAVESLSTRECWPAELKDIISEEDLEPSVPSESFWLGVPLSLGDIYLEVLRIDPAHTTSDAFVSVDNGRVLFTGDLVEEPPSVEAGSNLDGWDRTLATMAHACKPDGVVVPGHGPVCGREAIMATAAHLHRQLPARRPQPPKAQWQLPVVG